MLPSYPLDLDERSNYVTHKAIMPDGGRFV